MEIWKVIDGFDYYISNKGNIKNKKGKPIKASDNGKGYMFVFLCRNGEKHSAYVHRLVANAFLEKKNKDLVVNHKDYNRANNNVENLEWLTIKENNNYSLVNRIGKPHKSSIGTNTGIKYVSYYRNWVRVSIKHLRIDKKFKTMQEALEFRKICLGGV